MTANHPTVRKSFWKRKAFLFVAIPMSIAMMVFVYFATVQYQAAQRVDAEIQRIRMANLPIDAQSQNEWFIANTSREHSDAWAEILMLGDAAAGEAGVIEELPYIGNAKVPATINRDEPWASEPVVALWLGMTKPLIEKIHAVSGSKAPTWQPLNFEGVATLLEPVQSSRNIARILALDVEHALYVGDSERALRGLRSMNGLTHAFDWKVFLVSDLVTTALRGIHFATIQRSLSVDVWSDEQLAALSELVMTKQDVADRWRTVFAGERAIMIDEIMNQGAGLVDERSSGDALIFKIPSVRERLLFAYAQLETVADQGIESLAKNAESLQEQLFPDSRSGFSMEDSASSMVLPAVQAYAQALIRNEDSRRFTLTALAIKRYQLAKGQFPERLVQLKDIDLHPSDWTTVAGSVFGYDKDDVAYLWSYSFREPKIMPQERPENVEDVGNQLVTIR